MPKITGLPLSQTQENEVTSKSYVDSVTGGSSVSEITLIRNTTDNTPTDFTILTLNDDTTYTFEITISARMQNATSKGVGGKLKFVAYRNNASGAIIAADFDGAIKEIESYGTSGFDFDADVDGNKVIVTLTGDSTNVVSWTINAKIIENTQFIGVIATGGTITEIEDGGNDYRVHTFTDVGSTNFQIHSGSGDVEYLVVAGGGGGGSGGGGGGGAGGLRTGTKAALGIGTYTITVGNGGNGGSPSGTVDTGDNGGNSIFDDITSTGGGGGGYNGGATANGLSGGSGGGGGASGGGGTGGQGNNGGSGNVGSSPFPAGGGGGAGGVGSNSSGTTGGAGGVGLQNSISGTSEYYAGGGGGAVYEAGTAGGIGGNGGGGAGSHTGSGTGGQVNTGGGGGGATRLSGIGGNGGSGVVIIRYQI